MALPSLQVWETSASQKLEETSARVLVGICKPSDPVLEMNMTLCLSSEEMRGQHQTLIKAVNTLGLMDCIWEKKARLLCRRYLWAADRYVMTRRPGTASCLSLEADKMKIYELPLSSSPTTAHLD